MSELTYNDLIERFKSSSLEIVPSMPKVLDLDSLEVYLSELEDLDTHDLASGEVEGWDWVIYTHYGWKILHLVGQSDIDAAEVEYLELNSGVAVEDLCGGTFDIWSLQSNIAYHVLTTKLSEAVEELRGEMIELVETTISNLGG